MNQVVTELVVDARGAEAGSAAYVRSMQVAQAAVDRLRDRENALRDANEANGASMLMASVSTQRAASSYDRLKASMDPVFAASKGLERDLLTLDRAVTRLGISEAEAARTLDLITAKHDAAAAAARRHAQAATEAARPVPVDRLGFTGNDVFRRQNLAWQLQDVGVSLYSGMPMATVLVQQGAQIVGAYSGQGGARAAIQDFLGLLGSAARYAGPFIAAAAGVYGAYRLLSSYTQEAAAAIDGTTASLAAQAQPIASVHSGINELASLQRDYQEAIAATGFTQDAATNLIVSATEREFNAKKALLELELRRQEAAMKAQQAEMAVAGLQLEREIGSQVFTRMDLERQGYADPRIGSVPFVRLPDEVSGLDKTLDLLERSPIVDKLKEMRANAELTELAVEKLREAVKATFDDRSLLPGGSRGGPGAAPRIPIPTLRGIDDQPGSAGYLRDLERSTDIRIRQIEGERSALGLAGFALDAYKFKQDALLTAYRQNIELSPDVIAQINAQAEAYGAVASSLAQMRVQQDAAFERSQLFRTSSEQAIASRLHSAGLPVDFNSPEAQMLRDNQRIEELRDGIGGFVSDFRSEFLSNGGDFGEAFMVAFGEGINRQLDNYIEMGVVAIAEIASRHMGLTGSAGSFAPTLSGFADMLGIGDGVQRMQAAANSNLPLAAGGASYSVANATNFIRQYASSIGIDPDIALRVAKSEGLGEGIWQSHFTRGGFREPSFGPYQLLKGGQGTGFSAGLGNTFMARTGLDPADPANWQQSTAFALDQAKAGGWGPWYGAAKAGIGKWDGLTGLGKGMDSATQSIGRLADGASQAGNGLGKLGNDFSAFGSNLRNAFPAAPGSGGALGSLFGGLSSAFAGTGAYNWLSANPGGFIGLYHDGGIAGHPTMLRGGIDPSVFARAQRFHDGGFAADEVPAFLLRGERVLNRRETAEYGRGGQQAPTMTVVVNNAPAGTRVREESGKDASGRFYKRAVIDIMNEAIASGEVDGAMGGRFGAAVPTVRRGAA